MALIVDPDDLNQGTEVTITPGTRTVTLNIAGNLSSDGVTLQALYSFFKEEWKTDATLIPHDFPQIAITPEQFEWIEDWKPINDTTRKLIRTAGWREIDSSDVLQKEFSGVITLGTFEDSANDTAYYQQGDDPTDTTAAIDFDRAGPVNEMVQTYDNVTPADATTGFDFTTTTITRNDGGSWITDGYQIGARVEVANATTSANDGTYVITALTASVITTTGLSADTGDNTATFAVDRRNALKLFLRVRDADPNGKVYSSSNLSAIGVTELTYQAYRFPLSNSTDLKISETDANIGSNSPYTQIVVRYFDQSYQREVDSATKRDFGIVIDVGTFSGVDGASAASTTFTTAEGGIPTTTYDGGSLILHEGTDQGTHAISTASGTTVTLSSALTGSESNLSFTLQRSSPVVATAEEIYEKVQYLLRQATDIDSTDQTVVGETADGLLVFVGDTLVTGRAIPSNPNGGGSGVFIEGFDANDTNRLTFTDNTGTERTFPFVAAGSLLFNANLVNDSAGEYWMFFQYTTRTVVSDLVLTGTSDTLTSAGSNLPTLSVNDYIEISGLTGGDAAMNGIYQVDVVNTVNQSYDVSRYDGATIVTTSSASANVDQDPINSPDAIIVDDNSGTDIAGNVSGSSIGFDFDYDGNVQGGRTASTDANVVIRAIGLETAQFVETTGTITQAVGQTFSVVAALERNYSNP